MKSKIIKLINIIFETLKITRFLSHCRNMKDLKTDLEKGYQLFYDREDNIKKGLKTDYTSEEARLYFLALDDAFNLAQRKSGTSE